MREFLHFFDTGRQDAGFDAVDCADLTAFDDQVIQWPGTAKQRLAGLFLRIAERAGLVFPIIHFTLDDLAFAGTTSPVAATVWQVVAGFNSGREHGFVVGYRKGMAAGLQGDLMGHAGIPESNKYLN